MPKDRNNSTPPAAPKKKSEQQPERRTVQVRATKLGFYGNMLRPPGTVFNIKIAPDEKWPSWVEEVAGGEPEKTDETKSDTSSEQKGSSSDDVI